MQINAEQVMQLRKKRHWSQDELATAAGLNLRTVQRVEATGSASLQTLKAIASALESDLDAFNHCGESDATLRIQDADAAFQDRVPQPGATQTSPPPSTRKGARAGA